MRLCFSPTASYLPWLAPTEGFDTVVSSMSARYTCAGVFSYAELLTMYREAPKIHTLPKVPI